MNLYQQYDHDLARCNACAALLQQKPVDPSVSDQRVSVKPIVKGILEKPVMLIGQAPGIKEYESGKPFQGSAGKEIRSIFSEIGLSRFDEQVWSTAVVKCYPGRKWVKKRDGGRRIEDETPSTSMVKNCQPFLERQIALVKPKVIVTLGGFPLKAYLRLRGEPTSSARLEHYVGKVELWNDCSVVFFPHTSGASRWLNKHANKQLFNQAKQTLRKALFNADVITN